MYVEDYLRSFLLAEIISWAAAKFLYASAKKPIISTMLCGSIVTDTDKAMVSVIIKNPSWLRA